MNLQTTRITLDFFLSFKIPKINTKIELAHRYRIKYQNFIENILYFTFFWKP